MVDEIKNRSVWEEKLRLGLSEQKSSSVGEVIDLFSGCGGLSFGFQAGGFEVLRAFDSWKPAVETYNSNFAHRAEILDLEDVDSTVSRMSEFKTGREFPGIIGGPPCQDFSMAGKRLEADNAGLTENFSMIVKTFKPRFFVMENVPNAQHFQTYKSAIADMVNAGYRVSTHILDASDFGAPQKRKRIFAFGSTDYALSNNFVRRIAIEGAEARVRTQTSGRTTVRDWFHDQELPLIYYRHPRSYARRGCFSIDEPSPTIRGVNRPMPKTYNFNEKDKAVPGFGSLINPREIEPLSVLERKQIQTFPRDFRLTGTKTVDEQMVGNAVPVLLSYVIARAVNWAIANS